MSQGFASDQLTVSSYHEQIVTFTAPTDPLVVGTGQAPWQVPPSWGTGEILGVYASCHTAPTGASIIFDINKNDTTINTTQSNRPEIAAAANTSGAEDTPDVTGFVGGDIYKIDIDQVGSTVAGSVATVQMRIRRLT